MKDMHDYVGLRFAFDGRKLPDITVVAANPRTRTARLHAADGGRWNVPTRMLLKAIESGLLVESTLAPFVLDRVTKFDKLRKTRRARNAGSAGIATRDRTRIKCHADVLRGRVKTK